MSSGCNKSIIMSWLLLEITECEWNCTWYERIRKMTEFTEICTSIYEGIVYVDANIWKNLTFWKMLDNFVDLIVAGSMMSFRTQIYKNVGWFPCLNTCPFGLVMVISFWDLGPTIAMKIPPNLGTCFYVCIWGVISWGLSSDLPEHLSRSIHI